MISTIALAAIAATGATAASLNVTDSAGYINYTTITGYFLQDEPTTNASTFSYVSSPASRAEVSKHMILTTSRPKATSG